MISARRRLRCLWCDKRTESQKMLGAHITAKHSLPMRPGRRGRSP